MNRSISVALLALAVAACRREAPAAPPPSPCREVVFEQVSLIDCVTKGPIELVPGHRRFAELEQALGARAANVAFAMNGGMFDAHGAPIGLLVADGRQIHALNRRKGGGNFHLMPNGVFLVRRNGRAEVVPSDRYAPSPAIAFATQSGPMLVIDGRLNPVFDADGDSKYVRNGLGVGRDGRVHAVISQEVISFGRFGRYFRDGLGARNALYLDGSVSSLWDPANHRMDDFTDLGPMLVAFRPAAGSAPGRAGRARP